MVWGVEIFHSGGGVGGRCCSVESGGKVWGVGGGQRKRNKKKRQQ